MKYVQFLIAVLFFSFTSCHSKKAGRVTPSIFLNKEYVIRFKRSLIVPPTVATKQITYLESELDKGLEIQLKNAKLEIKRLKGNILDVKVTTEPQVIETTDTIYAQNYIEEDSLTLKIFQIIEDDTTLLATIEKPQQYYPAPKPPSTLTGIIVFLLALFYGIVKYLHMRKKRKEIS